MTIHSSPFLYRTGHPEYRKRCDSARIGGIKQYVPQSDPLPPFILIKHVAVSCCYAVLLSASISSHGLTFQADVDYEGAAVCILERFWETDGTTDRDVRGLARMVQVSSSATLVDLTVRGLRPGRYWATIRQYGNLKHGVSSTGPVWLGSSSGEARETRGLLGALEVDRDGRGSIILTTNVQVWEIIGHAMAVSRCNEADGSTPLDENDVLVGVIARSAGMWDNDKTVCSCTGKNLWQERQDMTQKGML
jgi:hypothetical protein